MTVWRKGHDDVEDAGHAILNFDAGYERVYRLQEQSGSCMDCIGSFERS
jgi:hypothetical protein